MGDANETTPVQVSLPGGGPLATPERWRVALQGRGVASAWRTSVAAPERPLSLAPLEQAAAALGAYELVLRLPDAQAEALEGALASPRWTHQGARVEWTLPVMRPPPPPPPALRWTPVRKVKRVEVEALLAASVRGDPHAPEGEAPGAWLERWASAPDLVGSLWVGATRRGPVCLAGAQVHLESGWGRLPYLGVRPEARGQGHGFRALIRGIHLLHSLGATTWNGGCAEENGPMLALVARLGVRPQRRLQQWRCLLSHAPSE